MYPLLLVPIAALCGVQQPIARYADPGVPASVESAPLPDPEARIESLRFTNSRGERVKGLLLKPLTGDGPFPIVLVLHGRGQSKERMVNTAKKEFTSRGVAVVALDAVGHGERTPPTIDDPARAFETTIQDYRQILSFLPTRTDLDTKKLGLIGFSMGAMMGTILTAVDTRIRAATIFVGGELATLPSTARLSEYAPRISPRPVCFVNGRQDEMIPVAAAVALQNSAKEPKTIFWYDGPHTLPKPEIRKGTDWLLEKLGVRPLEK